MYLGGNIILNKSHLEEKTQLLKIHDTSLLNIWSGVAQVFFFCTKINRILEAVFSFASFRRYSYTHFNHNRIS